MKSITDMGLLVSAFAGLLIFLVLIALVTWRDTRRKRHRHL